MVANFEKQADPTKKERLIASKKTWNSIVRLLRAKLKAFQKSINGHGDPHAQLPEVDLKDPFPVEFHTYLASIVDDYDKVIKGADFVMDMQDDFSVKRRKSKRELRELAAAIDTNDQMVVEASWWGSRAWAWFALHRLGKDARRTRLKMLNFVRRSVHALNTIEYQFTSSSPGSDVRAIVGLTKFINLYIGAYLLRLEQLKKIDEEGLGEPQQLPEGAAPSAAAEPGTEEIGDDIVSGPPPSAPNTDAIRASVGAELLIEKNKILNVSDYDKDEKTRLNDLYNKMLALAPKGSDEDFMDAYSIFKKHLEIAKGKTSNAQTEEEEYRKIAQNVLERWWSRKKMEWSATKSEDMKSQISDQLLAAVNSLKELMDEIESLDRTTADIEAKTAEVSAALKSAAEITVQFADDYRMEWRLEEDPKKRPARLEEGITSKLKKLIKSL